MLLAAATLVQSISSRVVRVSFANELVLPVPLPTRSYVRASSFMSAIDPAIVTQWAEAHRWITKATEDRRSAVLLLADDPPLLDPAAYHCQQAAEKLLKALLAAAGVTIPKTHDLQRLAALVIPLYPGIVAAIEVVSELTPWGTATRYPDLEADIGVLPEDIRHALKSLDGLHTAVIASDPTGSS